jgi:hypothetical protein
VSNGVTFVDTLRHIASGNLLNTNLRKQFKKRVASDSSLGEKTKPVIP